MQNLNNLDALFTHDIVHTGWNLPLNIAIQEYASLIPYPHFHLSAKRKNKIPISNSSLASIGRVGGGGCTMNTAGA